MLIRYFTLTFVALAAFVHSGTFPIFSGFQGYESQIGPSSSRARQYFDQGLVMYYGFNFLEAERSFTEAGILAPECAVCFWGKAAALDQSTSNPNDKWFKKGFAAIKRAQELSGNASVEQKGLIAALSTKYQELQKGDKKAGEHYVAALKRLFEQYPDNPDIRTLWVQAFMSKYDLSHGMRYGKPEGDTKELLAVLEAGIQQNPKHPGLLHFNIHALEACEMPEKAVGSAEALDGLVPGSGHLQHMPAHIYFDMGRYHEATLANQRSIEADRKFFEEGGLKDPDFAGFYLHTYYYLFESLVMEGRFQDAIAASRDLIQRLHSKDLLSNPYLVDVFYSVPYLLIARFGQWQEAMQEPAPAQELLYPLGCWLYMRGLAQAHLWHPDKAKVYLGRLKSLIKKYNFKQKDLHAFLLLAELHLNAELANPQEAIKYLQKAVLIEDKTNLEMSPWYLPMRQVLGQAYLDAGQPIEAEKMFREDLVKYPNNGWSLFGLAQSLKDQGKDSSQVEAAAKAAWKHADNHK